MGKFKLTKEHREAHEADVDGADVMSYNIARLLRECEPEGLVIICKAMGKYSAVERRPYFGALISAKGLAALKKVGK